MNVSNPDPEPRAALSKARTDGSVDRICNALLTVVSSDGDWRWLQDQCLDLLRHENGEVRGLAATCLGHIARLHGHLDRDTVIRQLVAAAASFPDIAGRVEDALSDIDMFLKADDEDG